MLRYTDLKKGIIFLYKGDPWLVLESVLVKLQRQKPTLKTKIKNLKTGVVTYQNFTQADSFKEARLNYEPIKFIYSHRRKYVFSKLDEPSKRFEFDENFLQDKIKYLKPGIEAEAVVLNNQIIDIKLPIKMDFKVIEAPPSFKGNTAQKGTKTVVIETGAKINAPIFVEVGDIIRVKTQDGKYVRRIKELKDR